MASKTVILLEDDTDGSEAAETVKFGLDGSQYEIDLSDKNADKLREVLKPWLSSAQRVGGSRRSTSTKKDLIDNSAVRAWAQSNGIELRSRGRIPADIIEKYHHAGR